MKVLDGRARRSRHASDAWRPKRGAGGQITVRMAARLFRIPVRLVRG